MSYSNSRIQQFKNCPLSYYFKYEVGLNKVKDDIVVIKVLLNALISERRGIQNDRFR